MNHSRLKHFGMSLIVAINVLFFLNIIVIIQGNIRPPEIDYELSSPGVYTFFSDGRFQVIRQSASPEILRLIDMKFEESSHFYVLRDIERYISLDNKLYISGDFSSGTTNLLNGKRIYYSDDDKAPKFLILDLQSETGEYYMSLDQLTQEEQSIFSENLSAECLRKKTCYGFGFNTNPSLFDIRYWFST